MNALTIILMILSIFLIIIVLVFVCSAFELGRFKVTDYHVNEGVPEFLKGKRIIFLSDYHEAENGKFNQKLLNKARELSPYLILLGGDMINANEMPSDCHPAKELINGLADISDVIYAFGNHEDKMALDIYGTGADINDFLSELKDNVHILRNDKYYINKTDKSDGVIYGIDFPLESYRRFSVPEFTADDIDQLVGKKEDAYSILLGHAPDFFEGYSSWKADIVLSGHFHGGIVRLPIIGGVISSRFKLFPRYDYGVYIKGNTRMIVTNGLGQHSLKLRLNNVPEIVCIHFDK